MISVAQQMALALATEVASLSLLDQSASDIRLIAFFSLHAVASGLITLSAYGLMPMAMRQPRGAVMGLLYGFAFFIPGLGLLCMVVVMQIAKRWSKVLTAERYAEIKAAEFHSTEKEKREQSDIRVGHARRILHDPSQSVDNKLRVLIALQSMKSRVAVPLLQGLLGDPSEDIRLLAYSMMDSWEKDLTVKVQHAQAKLVEAKEKSNVLLRLSAHRRLSELYWEQVDSGLARGDLRQYALEQSKSHIEKALTIDANSGSTWLLYGQVLTELHMTDLAQRTLKLAHAAGAPDADVLPLLARLSFDEGHYDEVVDFMASLHELNELPHNLRQTAMYWNRKNVDYLI